MDNSESMVYHSCPHCERVVITELPLPGQAGHDTDLHSVAKIKFPHTDEEALEAFRDGCALFQLFSNQELLAPEEITEMERILSRRTDTSLGLCEEQNYWMTWEHTGRGSLGYEESVSCRDLLISSESGTWSPQTSRRRC